jgi:hypothetical protein
VQELILIISKCERIRKNAYEFHFKGFYLGEKIKILVVTNSEKVTLELDINYLLWAKKVDLINGILKVEILKIKKIQ